MTDDKIHRAILNVVGALRSDVLHACELVLADEPEKFLKLRKRILNLFGMARGAERQLLDLFDHAHRCHGQARSLEACGKDGDTMRGG